MVNLPTKFELPNFTRYGNMKGVAKCRKIGWFGVISGQPSLSAMSQFDRAHTTFYSSLIETTCILYRLSDVAFDRSTIALFCYPLVFSAPDEVVLLGRSP